MENIWQKYAKVLVNYSTYKTYYIQVVRFINDKKYVVYEHLFPNGKRYIGITSKIPEKRWENGCGYTKSKQPAMYNAVQKYGWENIKHNILFTDLISAI